MDEKEQVKHEIKRNEGNLDEKKWLEESNCNNIMF